MNIDVPWRAWYGDQELRLEFPSLWQVASYPPADAPDIGAAGIEAAFERPIGTPPLAELARGARRVAIAVDDVSRPAPAARLMPILMRQLERAGVDLDNTRVVMAVGTHAPMGKGTIVKKLGAPAAGRLDVHNSFPYDNLAELGVSERGTPVHICRFFAQADLKIGVGSITPHGGPGFGGGAKVVVPGVAGIETIAAIHRPGRFKTGLGKVEGNELRADIEQMVRDRVGLDLIVNVVVNSRREVAGLFVGDMILAHRAGVELARKVYATAMPREPVDIAICNAYPKDTDFLQNAMALNVLASSPKPVLKEGGTVVIITASPEGRGYHGLYGPGMRYDPLRGGKPVRFALPGVRDVSLVYFSPNLSPADVRGATLFREWSELVRHLQGRYGHQATVAVFPCSSIQLAGEEEIEGG